MTRAHSLHAGARLAALHCSWISCLSVCLRISGEVEEGLGHVLRCANVFRGWGVARTHCSPVRLAAGPVRLSVCLSVFEGRGGLYEQALLVTLSGGLLC